MEPKLATLLGRSGRQKDICEAFALLWIAAASAADLKTWTILNGHLAAIPGAMECADTLRAIIAADDLDSFLLASRVLHRELEAAEKDRFLNQAIGVALANQQLTTSANHILRLYSDLLGLGRDYLDTAYREYAGVDFPEPGDPSSVLWWEAQQQSSSDHHQNYVNSPGRRFSRAEAYAVLGLEKEAPSAEIKRAYRRLVQNYHPDRYQTLGSDARELAERKFLRVQQAYEVLSQ